MQNLAVKTWLKILLLSSIYVILNQSNDANNKDKNLKVKIYYMALKTLLKHINFSFFFK